MVYQERNTWAGLIASVVGVGWYIVVMLQALAAHPVDQINWVDTMLWAIGIGIVGAIVLSIVWGIIAGMLDRSNTSATDVRDREIERMGSRVGQAFLVIAGLGVLVLCAVSASPFWIANTMFLGFALSAFVGGVAQVIAYRRGLV